MRQKILCLAASLACEWLGELDNWTHRISMAIANLLPPSNYRNSLVTSEFKNEVPTFRSMTAHFVGTYMDLSSNAPSTVSTALAVAQHTCVLLLQTAACAL